METSVLKATSDWQQYQILAQLPELMKSHDLPWHYALSEGQILSKIWIVQTLRQLGINNLNQVMILGGWIGLLGSILLGSDDLGVTKVRSFDSDRSVRKIADTLNLHYVAKDWKFKAAYGDWNELNYAQTSYETERLSDGTLVSCTDIFHTIINTCCEHSDHLERWLSKVPSDRLLILQSNDSTEFDGHVNPCSTLDEFKSKAGLGRLLFSGELPTSRYTRWMLIGYRP